MLEKPENFMGQREPKIILRHQKGVFEDKEQDFGSKINK